MHSLDPPISSLLGVVPDLWHVETRLMAHSV